MSLVATLVSLLLFNNMIELDMVVDIPKTYSTYEFDKSNIQEMLGNIQFEKEPELAENIEYEYINYRQTYFGVYEGEKEIGSQYKYNDDKIEVIDNVMNFEDDEYGHLPIYAVNIDDVLGSGFNEVGTPNLYGSVIEITDGVKTWLGIVMDACGMCSKESKIDIWVYYDNVEYDIQNISFKYIRYGW